MRPKLAADGGILDVPENAELLALVEKARLLNPRQLLEMSARLRPIKHQDSLANHLAAIGFSALAHHDPVISAVRQIDKVEVGWSLFGDVWKAIVNTFGGSSTSSSSGSSSGGGGRDDYGSTPTASGCQIKCVTPVFGGGLMVEKCKNDRNWRVIGVCFGSSF